MPKSLYALVGEDGFLQTEKLREILAEMPADVQRIDMDGERAEMADVLDEVRSYSMFGGYKVVVVYNADEFISRFREPLEPYFEKPTDSATLILRCKSLPSNYRISKLIAKNGQFIKLESPKAAALTPWIINRAKSPHKLQLTPAAANMLKDFIGDDMGRIDNELAKLALQTETGKIDVKEVAGSVAFQREQEMWVLSDEIGSGKTAQALKRWRQLTRLDTSAEFRAVTWLGIWLEKAVKALAMKQRGDSMDSIARDLKIFPFEKSAAFVKTAERLGEAGLSRTMDLLVKIDHQSKSGIGDAAANVERFLLAVGNELKGR